MFLIVTAFNGIVGSSWLRNLICHTLYEPRHEYLVWIATDDFFDAVANIENIF